MSLRDSDAERLGERHYLATMDRGRGCAFRIECEQFEARRKTHGGNFCVILHGDAEEADDFFVIPHQVLAPALAGATPTRRDGDGSCLGWEGAIVDDTTLSIA